MEIWKRWLQHPERTWLHRISFHIHYWTGIVSGLYALLIAISGSILVFRNELPSTAFVRWLLRFHEDLFAGDTGRLLNGAAALSVLLLCLTGAAIWWPGVQHWRRSLTIKWHTRLPRFTWDFHSAIGFWTFPWLLIWALSGSISPSRTRSPARSPSSIAATGITTCGWRDSPTLTSGGSTGSRKLSGARWAY